MFEIPSLTPCICDALMPSKQLLEVATLVCPFSIWHGRGFYVELFSIKPFATAHQFKTKRPF